jgi:hypothetical protein
MCHGFRRDVGFFVEGFQPVGILTFGLVVPILLEAGLSVFWVEALSPLGLPAC